MYVPQYETPLPIMIDIITRENASGYRLGFLLTFQLLNHISPHTTPLTIL